MSHAFYIATCPNHHSLRALHLTLTLTLTITITLALVTNHALYIVSHLAGDPYYGKSKLE
jgi:hypothetical protein